MHGPRRVITFCLLTAVLPTVLLVIPLYLRHSVYADVSYEVTESDVLEMVEGISSVFCQEHSLRMNSTFSAFKLNGDPTLSPKRRRVRMKKSMALPDDTLEYWGFYLLKGSTIVVTVCSRYEGGRVMLVRGERNLKTCGLLQHNSRRQRIEVGVGGQSIKEQPEGNNVRMMFERKSDRRLEVDGMLSAEVNQLGVRTLGKQEMSEGSQEGGVGQGEEGWGESGQGGGRESGGPRGSVGGGGEWEVKAKKQGWETDDEEEEDDDEGESSGRGGIEMLRQPRAAFRSKQAFERSSDLGREGRSDGVLSRELLDIMGNRRRLGKREGTKGTDLDTLERYHGGVRAVVAGPRVERLDRLRKDLEGEVKQRRKREDVRLVDTGLRHGGTAIGYVKEESEEDSDSSFELGLKECYGGLVEHHQSFEPSQTCTEDVASESTDINGAEESKNSLRFAYDIVESGYYYFIFYSDNDRVINSMHAAFDIHKTVYEYESQKTENSSEKCVNSTECTFTVGFLSGATVMVEIPHRDGIDRDLKDEVGGPQGALLISSCHPRMAVYIVFPIAVLFLILGCAFL
ncbi:uncharacterized protein [Hetaerina americana]|uniref:uncharacterized protein n=1 Tax=Hetaerina americana TaxID=62018 RepID=UPI003A7F10B2